MHIPWPRGVVFNDWISRGWKTRLSESAAKLFCHDLISLTGDAGCLLMSRCFVVELTFYISTSRYPDDEQFWGISSSGVSCYHKINAQDRERESNGGPSAWGRQVIGARDADQGPVSYRGGVKAATEHTAGSGIHRWRVPDDVVLSQRHNWGACQE